LLFQDGSGKAPPVVEAADNEPAADDTEKPKGVAGRNELFRKWYHAKGSNTYHFHATIMHKWNGLPREEKAKVCPASPIDVTREVVIQGVRRAEAARKPRVKKPARKRAKGT
jgi:hypothetical protein